MIRHLRIESLRAHQVADVVRAFVFAVVSDMRNAATSCGRRRLVTYHALLRTSRDDSLNACAMISKHLAAH